MDCSSCRISDLDTFTVKDEFNEDTTVWYCKNCDYRSDNGYYGEDY